MKRPKLSTLLICVALFFFFLLLRFPYQNLKGYIFGKIYSQTRISITGDEIYPTFFGWPGMGIKHVSLSIPLGLQDLELSGDRLTTRVGIGGLFPPTPSFSLRVDGLKKGGDIYARYSENKSGLFTSFYSHKANLAQLNPSGSGETYSGLLNADGNLNLYFKEESKSSGQAQIQIEKLKIASQNIQGFFLPAVNVGNVIAKLQVKNGLAEVAQFQFGDATTDLKGTFSGDLRLNKDLMRSHANLTLRFQVSDAFRKDPKAGSILAFLDGYYKSAKTNDYAMRWTGTLEDITTRTPLPQKVD